MPVKSMDDAILSMHYKDVRKVLWRVLIANITITVLKIGLGIFTGALAVVADGFHSLVDSSSNLVGLAAIRLASRPPDDKHPYGYRRYETIGAMAIGGLLLVAAWEILKGIIQRITEGGIPEVTPFTFTLVLLTFPVNLAIVILETRSGRRLKSEILLADATHTKTDLWVTGSVIASLTGVWLGIQWLDLFVAAGVGVLIVRAAFGILQDASRYLTDSVILDADKIDEIARNVPGVLYVHAIRSRGTPDAKFIDLHVKVHSGMSTEQAHAIASEVEYQLKSGLENVVETLVHIEPSREEAPSNWDRISFELRQIADGMGMGVHDLHVRVNQMGGYAIELHLEMPREISLRKAHDLAEEFENRVHQESTKPLTIITHLEPLPENVIQTAPQNNPNFTNLVKKVVTSYVGEENLIELENYRSWEHTNVVARLMLPGDVSLLEAHNIAERIERDLIARFPEIYRVVVHMEPSDNGVVHTPEMPEAD